EITHVHRGEEHTTNTPKQLVIYDLLGWEAPVFGHLTIITNMEGKKLSKRDLSVKQFIEDYKDEGYHPDALLNFLALLGWTHPQAKEVMTKEQIIEAFTSERFSKSSSKFDSKKMDWFSKEYIKNLPNNLIIEKLETRSHDKKWLDLFVETYKQNAITYSMIQKSLAIYDNKEVKDMESTEVLKTFANEISKRSFEVVQIQEAINATKGITGAKGKELFMPLREVTTYQEHGPELAKAIYLVGEELVKERLKKVS
ncbi:MAG: glutamate--tRNA ligase, partial [Mycoplasmataceae bacterium]|nr:glutamate--tRNA ligase [Mycoplasmataceae bacterium]